MKLLWFQSALLAGLVFCGTAVAGPPEKNTDASPVIGRLDVILQRLDEIEQRLAKLEANSRVIADWWVDERGVLRSGSGRPIGFWGIDGPITDQTR